MIAAGLEALPVGCRSGGCGTCRIQVLGGRYAALRMSRSYVSEDEQRQGFALACRVIPRSDLVVQAAPLAVPHEVAFPV